ncbi:MAG: tetratricopeptide repeat protein [Planctomycetaceae bacterium]
MHRSRVWLKRLTLGVCLAAVSYFGLVWYVRHEIARDLREYQPEHALKQLVTLQSITWLTDSDRLQQLEILRKLGETSAFASLAGQLRQRGYESEVGLQETLMLAQGNGVKQVADRLPHLLVSGQGNVADICDAFAGGFMNSHQTDRALTVLKAWKLDFPDDPRAILMTGRIQEFQGDWDSAFSTYRHAADVCPGFGPAAYQAGRVLLRQKLPEQALPWFETAAAWLTTDVPARVGMAKCYRALNQPEQARSILMSIRQNPIDSERQLRAFRLLGETIVTARTAVDEELGQLQLADQDFSGAIESLKRASDCDPLNHKLKYLLGRAYVGDGRRDEAEPLFDDYREANEKIDRLDRLIDRVRDVPEDLTARTQAGEILLKYVNENQGLVWLHAVLEADPSFPEALSVLAEFHQRRAAGPDAREGDAQQAAEFRLRLNQLPAASPTHD